MIELLLIASLTFIDGIVIGGLVVNGWVAFAACVYAYTKCGIPIIAIAAASFVGVFLGEQVSFVLTTRYGLTINHWIERSLARIYVLRKDRWLRFVLPSVNPEKWSDWQARASMQSPNWVVWALIVGRWTPLACLMPALCGLTKITYRRFTLISGISCLLWAGIWNLLMWASVKGYVSIFTLPKE
jgi:membrane protein DedA with SNARE-associated domain